MLDIPYFMTNREWYRFDFNKRKYVLTDKATPEAVESYNEYVQVMESAQKKGITL